MSSGNSGAVGFGQCVDSPSVLPRHQIRHGAYDLFHNREDAFVRTYSVSEDPLIRATAVRADSPVDSRALTWEERDAWWTTEAGASHCWSSLRGHRGVRLLCPEANQGCIKFAKACSNTATARAADSATGFARSCDIRRGWESRRARLGALRLRQLRHLNLCLACGASGRPAAQGM